MPPRRADADGALRRLSTRLGIETRYRDQGGDWHDVPAETLHALCRTLAGVDDPRDAGDLLAARAGAAMPPALVVAADAPSPQHLPLNTSRGEWTLHEDGGRVRHGRGTVLPAALPAGYHRLEVHAGRGAGTAHCMLIAAPRRAYLPAALQRGRVWGLASQLYALRSDRDWGIGDFTDLETLIARAATRGADVVGVNPLHALFPDEPERASPYSPSSRLFVNPLYVDPEAIEDYAECDAARRLAEGAARHRLRGTLLVDYTGVGRLKRRVLDLLYESFRARHLRHADDARARQFRTFQQRGGAALRRFAIFHALRERAAGRGSPRAWRDWPEGLRDPGAAAVRGFAQRHARDVERHEYLQWQADRQLARAAGTARSLGMAVGLYQDLAVGFDPDGADAWALQDMVAGGWTIGSPPDAWSPKGQDWGLAPLNPQRLRDAGYAPIVDTLRTNMRHAGALRIDHVLGLKRFFWVPQGGTPADGAYVRYPFDDLLGVVALESQRRRCVVVGEDLGTVPPGFSAALQRRGVLSYRLLYFSRTAGGGFEAPRRYPAAALAAISTHDLPTLAGYWHGDDIALRRRLGLYRTADHARRDRRDRGADRRALLAALTAERLRPPRGAVPADAAHRFLARSPARIVMAQIEDLIGVRAQANLPGTTDQHPNWRRKLPLTLDRLFADARLQRGLSAIAGERPSPAAGRAAASPVPRATYRLQLTREFTFADAAAAVPYLARLGISHLYLSPIFEAQPDSTHGYDTTSFDRLSPELGGANGFDALRRAAEASGLKILLDFVPNHMGVGQARNEWWLDLLEWGRHSPAARIFDVDWQPAAWPELSDRITVPLLGEPVEELIRRRELAVRFDAQRGSFALWYHSHCFPVRPADYPLLLDTADRRLRRRPVTAAALARLARGFARLAEVGDPYQRGQRLKRDLAHLAARDRSLARALAHAARDIAGPRLAGLLERQVYRLAFWRTAGQRINYRRFFDINQLASLRMEDPRVFERCHRAIAGLVADRRIHGIRLDHVDGLYDPGEYCRRLRRLVDANAPAGRDSPSVYIAVEKILGPEEALRRDWPVEGTTGYEFTNWVNGLLVKPDGAVQLDRLYRRFTGRTRPFAAELREAKRLVVEQLFGGEIAALTARVARLDGALALSPAAIKAALQAYVVEFPIYRSYVGQRGASAEDRRLIDQAIARARRHLGKSEAAVLRVLRTVLTAAPRRGSSPRQRIESRDIAVRIQQLTAPVQAKALEDTAFYRYVRLLSLNEVGGDPDRFGMTAAAFHDRMRRQVQDWPHSMLATATHDTKRGEDARARISVLSEVPGRWAGRVARWSAMNRALAADRRGERSPSRNDEYFLYQALLGAWPMALTGDAAPDRAALAALRDRLAPYVEKAVREAKLRSSWLAPDDAYESACRTFLEGLLDTRRSRRFLADFQAFAREAARLGALNSLTQTALKLVVPGVPDIYRGCELWDLSLVDPDNRRPISLAERDSLLGDLAAEGRAPDMAALARDWRSGRIKLHVIARLLALRRTAPDLFAGGSYEPLAVRGPLAGHVMAFRRRRGGDAVIVVAGRWFAALPTPAGRLCPRADAWDGTVVPLRGRTGNLVEALTGRDVAADSGALRLATIFRDLPLAVLSTVRV